MPDEKYKGRRTEVYFPSQKFLEKWKGQSKSAKMTLSSWIFQTVETSLDTSTTSIQEITRAKSSLQDENRQLRRDLENTMKLMEVYKTEVFTLRNEVFLKTDLNGRGKFDDRLLRTLRSGGVWRARDILRELDVDAKDIDAIQIVTKQLQTLQDIGIVQESAVGWKWVG
jgi:hypothetical protein